MSKSSIRSAVKLLILFILSAFFGVFLIALFTSEPVDFQHAWMISIGGMIGIIIVEVFRGVKRKVAREEDDKSG
jgi:glycopeptide antibiotics resistance protein